MNPLGDSLFRTFSSVNGMHTHLPVGAISPKFPLAQLSEEEGACVEVVRVYVVARSNVVFVDEGCDHVKEEPIFKGHLVLAKIEFEIN